MIIICKHSSTDNLIQFQKMNDSLPLEIEENYQTLNSKTRSEITLLDPFRQAYNFSTLYCICLWIKWPLI